MLDKYGLPAKIVRESILLQFCFMVSWLEAQWRLRPLVLDKLGLPAKIVEEYILLAALLHVFVA